MFRYIPRRHSSPESSSDLRWPLVRGHITGLQPKLYSALRTPGTSGSIEYCCCGGKRFCVPEISNVVSLSLYAAATLLHDDLAIVDTDPEPAETGNGPTCSNEPTIIRRMPRPIGKIVPGRNGGSEQNHRAKKTQRTARCVCSRPLTFNNPITRTSHQDLGLLRTRYAPTGGTSFPIGNSQKCKSRGSNPWAFDTIPFLTHRSKYLRKSQASVNQILRYAIFGLRPGPRARHLLALAKWCQPIANSHLAIPRPGPRQSRHPNQLRGLPHRRQRPANDAHGFIAMNPINACALAPSFISNRSRSRNSGGGRGNPMPAKPCHATCSIPHLASVIISPLQH